MFFINGSRGGVFFFTKLGRRKNYLQIKKKKTLFCCFNMTRDDVDQENVHMS